jgi:hypothetical protein
MLMKIHMHAASMVTTSVVAFTDRYDRIGSFGKFGCMGQMLEPFDTAVKVNVIASMPCNFHSIAQAEKSVYFAVSS